MKTKKLMMETKSGKIHNDERRTYELEVVDNFSYLGIIINKETERRN